MASNADKTMSSRLMTMKFMQRATASSNALHAEHAAQPSSTKRRKLDKDSPPARDTFDEANRQPLRDEGEKQRAQILDRQAAEAGDAKWVLNQARLPQVKLDQSLKVTDVGFATIDAGKTEPTSNLADGVASRPILSGRKSFGNFIPQVEKSRDHGRLARPRQGGDDQSTDSAESDRLDDDDDDDDVEKTNLKGGLKRSRSENEDESSGTALLAERQKNEGAKLKKLTSISSGGGKTQSKSPLTSYGVCYVCGSKGHKKKDCPKRNTNRP